MFDKKLFSPEIEFSRLIRFRRSSLSIGIQCLNFLYIVLVCNWEKIYFILIKNTNLSLKLIFVRGIVYVPQQPYH
jgi:hypothetical protein